MLPLMSSWSVDANGARSVCILDGLFRLLLETWHALAPMVNAYRLDGDVIGWLNEII